MQTTDDRVVVALTALARAKIQPDIQELLISGDPMRDIAPGALGKALEAALSTPAPVANDWQPIETAPKDGKPLDLWLGDDEFPHRIPDAYWGKPYHSCGEAGRYCDCCPPDLNLDAWRDPLAMGMDVGGIKGATHWMRPAAPTQDKNHG
jgi:hypothetical protein